jgi:fatty acid desaturase
MSGSSSRLLPPETLRALTRRSDAQGALRLAIHLALLAGAGALVWRAQGWAIVPAMVLLGIVQVTLFAPLHETMHLTAFASRRVNAVVGWLVSCPSLLNWHFYAALHWDHHRFTQDPARDPELTPPAARRPARLPRARQRVQFLARADRGDRRSLARRPRALPLHPRTRARVAAGLRWMSVLLLALSLGAAWAVG